MLTQSLAIARKELLDSARDIRAMFSSLMYCLMGPAVVLMVSIALHGKNEHSADVVLGGMMAVFTLVAAFSGGMNVAMDILAGERERRSLLPLLINAVPRPEVALGKSLAVSCFSSMAVAVNLAGFAVVACFRDIAPRGDFRDFLLMPVWSLLPMALLASASELAISTACRTLKEAQTYLSMSVFVPMGLGMFAVFVPKAGESWLRLLPVIGQQMQMQGWMAGSQCRCSIRLHSER